jgi:hypothetical protein
MGRPGFEPGTNRLKAEYSTVELATLIFSYTKRLRLYLNFRFLSRLASLTRL